MARRAKNRPIRNTNCLWRPCLLMDQHKINNLYKGPSINASYQVSVHLAEGFQRRRLTIFQLYHGGQFYRWMKPVYPEKTTSLSQVTHKTLSHKHLGLTISNDGNWGKHVDLITKKAFTRVNIMRKF